MAAKRERQAERKALREREKREGAKSTTAQTPTLRTLGVPVEFRFSAVPATRESLYKALGLFLAAILVGVVSYYPPTVDPATSLAPVAAAIGPHGVFYSASLQAFRSTQAEVWSPTHTQASLVNGLLASAVAQELGHPVVQITTKWGARAGRIDHLLALLNQAEADPNRRPDVSTLSQAILGITLAAQPHESPWDGLTMGDGRPMADVAWRTLLHATAADTDGWLGFGASLKDTYWAVMAMRHLWGGGGWQRFRTEHLQAYDSLYRQLEKRRVSAEAPAVYKMHANDVGGSVEATWIVYHLLEWRREVEFILQEPDPHHDIPLFASLLTFLSDCQYQDGSWGDEEVPTRWQYFEGTGTATATAHALWLMSWVRRQVQAVEAYRIHFPFPEHQLGLGRAALYGMASEVATSPLWQGVLARLPLVGEQDDWAHIGGPVSLEATLAVLSLGRDFPELELMAGPVEGWGRTAGGVALVLAMWGVLHWYAEQFVLMRAHVSGTPLVVGSMLVGLAYAWGGWMGPLALVMFLPAALIDAWTRLQREEVRPGLIVAFTAAAMPVSLLIMDWLAMVAVPHVFRQLDIGVVSVLVQAFVGAALTVVGGWMEGGGLLRPVGVFVDAAVAGWVGGYAATWLLVFSMQELAAVVRVSRLRWLTMATFGLEPTMALLGTQLAVVVALAALNLARVMRVGVAEKDKAS